jgi:hypothetical protein
MTQGNDTVNSNSCYDRVARGWIVVWSRLHGFVKEALVFHCICPTFYLYA